MSFGPGAILKDIIMCFECTRGEMIGPSGRKYSYGRFVGGKYGWFDVSTLKCEVIPVEEVMRKRKLEHIARQINWALAYGHIATGEVLRVWQWLMDGGDLLIIIRDLAHEKGEIADLPIGTYLEEPNCTYLRPEERTYVEGREWTIG